MPSIVLDSTRVLAAPAREVRAVIVRALHDAGFEVKTEQLTLVEATRGSMVASAFFMLKQLPIKATVRLNPGPGGCGVAIRLADGLVAMPGGRTWGVNTPYEGHFRDIHEQIDARLAKLDPAAAEHFEAPSFFSKVPHIAALEKTNVAGGKLGVAAAGRVSTALEGGPRKRTPKEWRNVASVTFRCGDEAAILELEELQGHLAVAVMVASQAGSLPPKLASELEVFAARVESQLGKGAQAVTIEVAAEEKPILGFLHQQTQIREALPVRTLHICRTCKLQKVTNPDYQRLMKRNQRLRNIFSGVGASITGSGLRPFLVVGTMFKFARLDPDYVCSRCQGTDAEERIVTFCPNCGVMRTEAVLQRCARCKHDFRSDAKVDQLWGPAVMAIPQLVTDPAVVGNDGGAPEQSTEVAAQPVPIAMPAPKRCQVCGLEFASLWKVTVSSADGPQELMVCGAPPRCAPPSLTPPVAV